MRRPHAGPDGDEAITDTVLEQVRRLHTDGTRSRSLGQPDRAREALDAALALLDGAPRSAAGLELTCRILMTLGLVDFEQDGLEVSLATMDRAITAATQSGVPELSALCHSQSASLYGRAGLFNEARQELAAASPHLGALQPRDRCELLLTRGSLATFLAEYDEAARDFELAERIAESNDLPAPRFMARHNRGYVAFVTGDVPTALTLMRSADAMDVDVSRSVPRLDHGRALLAAGLLDEARAVLAAGLAVSLEDGQHQVSAELEMEAARANLLLGRLGDAAELARSAQSRLADRGTTVWAGRCELLLWQILAEGVEPAATAHRIALARSAEQLAGSEAAELDPGLFRDAHLLAARLLIGTGTDGGTTEVTTTTRDALEERAARHLAEATARPTAAGISPLGARLDRAYVTASVAHAGGDLDRALQALRAAADDLAGDQILGGSLDLRTAVSLHATRLADLDLTLARQASPAAVFDAAERWRAASLRVPGVRPANDPELAEALARLRGLEAAVRDGRAGTDDLADARHEVQQIARGITLATPGDQHQPVGLDQTHEALRAGGAGLIQLIDHRGEVLALTLSADGVGLTSAGTAEQISRLARRVRADLAMVAGRELGVMTAAVQGSLRAGLDELDRRLIRPLKMGTERLVLVTSASTRALPWAMLPSLQGAPITVAQSATQWTRGARTSPTGAGGRTTPRVVSVAGPGLAHAAGEAEAVAAAWGNAERTLTGDRATTDAVTRALNDADLVHLAAHGTHERQNPMFARLRLHDGSVYVHDLEARGVTASHVVLSACDVGASTTRPGEEVLGLTAGLLALGTTTVVAAVCRIPDDVAAEAMTTYHHHLAAGAPADVSLATATSTGPELAGAFAVYGSVWQQGDRPQPPAHSRP
ncbi:CHAT domain-containing protein [Euzebya tangerina]|uniref:CHAT domain-containing protein n=1 Tax=Euzebya tangerina TaxID=591198 RepID=UPI000E30F1E7|nr:CHAT domain-containing protein [Euzebya tangerina]